MSYSHKDSNRVYPVLDALYDKKYRIWYDESCENGNDFRDELRVRIEAADAILVFVSQNSMASPFCGMEIIVARENGKRLYPIYLDNVELPPAFQLLFANTHHSTADNLDKLVRAMVRDLPATAMDRLTKNNDVVERCEDNGTDIEIDEGIRIIADGAFKDRIPCTTSNCRRPLKRSGRKASEDAAIWRKWMYRKKRSKFTPAPLETASA